MAGEIVETIVSCSFHLADGSQVKRYIDSYDNNETALKLLVEKRSGKSVFKGISPMVDFYGMVDTRIQTITQPGSHRFVVQAKR